MQGISVYRGVRRLSKSYSVMRNCIHQVQEIGVTGNGKPRLPFSRSDASGTGRAMGLMNCSI